MLRSTYPPTKNQKLIFEFLVKFIKEHKYSPTQAEIAEHFDIGRPLVNYYLTELEIKGYVTTPGKNNRNLILLKKTIN